MSYFAVNPGNMPVALPAFGQAFAGAGEAQVYEVPGTKLVAKIFHEQPSQAKANFLSVIMAWSKGQLATVAALPQSIIYDNASHVVGYTMRSCRGWHNLGELLQPDSDFGLKEIAWVFCRLHQALSLAHTAGFLIGDFNPGNVLFQLDASGCQVCLVDSDSWNWPEGRHYSQMLKPTQAQHPELYRAVIFTQALPAIQPKHDWWSFAFLLFCSLTKRDPFSGRKMTTDGQEQDYEDRVLDKLTIRYPDVERDLDTAKRLSAIGKAQLIVMDRLLTTKTTGCYPLWLLADLYQNLRHCQCGQEVNCQVGFCPYCATVL